MSAVPARTRLGLALFLGLAMGGRAYTVAGRGASDFAQIWLAAHALLDGRNPYRVVGPGLAYPFRWPFFYPLPAALVGLPLTSLRPAVATGVFIAIAAACFAWALMAHGYAPLLGMLSAAMIVSAELGQWAPLLAAAVALAPLGALAVAKPTLGAAVFLARPSWWCVGGAIVLGSVAFLLSPGWLGDWRDTFVRFAAHRPLHFRVPLGHPGGALALLALLRWRRPEARLVAALACVPQTMILYESLPLFLVPRTTVECGALVLLSYAAQVGLVVSGDDLIVGGRWIVWLLYLPATLMVLRRPNEGSVPAWLEQLVKRWPVGRGSADSARNPTRSTTGTIR